MAFPSYPGIADISEGFGQHFLDWGNHLAPGWKGRERRRYHPFFEEKGGFLHGTVQRHR